MSSGTSAESYRSGPFSGVGANGETRIRIPRHGDVWTGGRLWLCMVQRCWYGLSTCIAGLIFVARTVRESFLPRDMMQSMLGGLRRYPLSSGQSAFRRSTQWMFSSLSDADVHSTQKNGSVRYCSDWIGERGFARASREEVLRFVGFCCKTRGRDPEPIPRLSANLRMET